ncbi:MAG: YceD family protein [Candidatus Nanopelagicales bacterium]
MTTTAGAPFVVDVRALIGKPGAYERIALTEAAGPDVRTDIVAVPEDQPVTVEVMLESVQEGILVTGRAATVGLAECSRCLDPVEVDLTADLQELYAWTAAEAEVDELGELGPHLDGDLLDLRPAVRDDLLLDSPIAPLCSVDCPGLCPQCGVKFADSPEHTHETSDPRWAALSTLKDDLLDQQADIKEN